MTPESLLSRARKAVSSLVGLGTAPAEHIANQSASDIQSIYNAFASQVQGNPACLNASERHSAFELACQIWVSSPSKPKT